MNWAVLFWPTPQSSQTAEKTSDIYTLLSFREPCFYDMNGAFVMRDE